MKGLIRTAAALIAGAAVAGAGHAAAQDCPGCAGYGDAGAGGLVWTKYCYDRCWPERYSNLAQRAVNRSFAPQVMNGHVLDQTVWNHHFEAGTARLTPGGVAHLQYLSRRRPEPDRTVYLATATDLAYDPACPERYCGAKQELDALRAAAVQKFLVGSNCGRCADFHVLVHDPADVSISARAADRAVQNMYTRYRAGLLIQADARMGGAGGGSGSSSSAGGGTASSSSASGAGR